MLAICYLHRSKCKSATHFYEKKKKQERLESDIEFRTLFSSKTFFDLSYHALGVGSLKDLQRHNLKDYGQCPEP